MSSFTINVKNIPPQTDDSEIKDFFSFCGKISKLEVNTAGETKEATIDFEKETASNTALLLDKTQFGDRQIVVTGRDSNKESSDDVKQNAQRSSDEITQEEKPRARIFAEYLAHGYNVSHFALKKAIDLDQKHGVSTRFLNTLQGFDQKYNASDRVKTADQSYGISQRANSLMTGFNSYFEKASNTITGRKIVKFYSDTQRQVTDIHNEAKRLAELRKNEHGGSSYKAAGLDRVFGPEKTQEKTSDSKQTTNPSTVGAPTNPIEAEDSQLSIAPSNAQGGNETSTPIARP